MSVDVITYDVHKKAKPQSNVAVISLSLNDMDMSLISLKPPATVSVEGAITYLLLSITRFNKILTSDEVKKLSNFRDYVSAGHTYSYGFECYGTHISMLSARLVLQNPPYNTPVDELNEGGIPQVLRAGIID